MDKKYIEMFATADKIQEHEYEIGDTIAQVEYDSFDRVIIARTITKTKKEKGEIVKLFTEIGWTYNTDASYLPTTDQIAEMWGEAKNNIPFEFEFFVEISFWLEKTSGNYIKTDYPLQVIALAFLMSDLHGLKWVEKGGKGWVKG